MACLLPSAGLVAGFGRPRRAWAKTSKGIYQKIGKEIHVLDLEKNGYQLATSTLDSDIEALLKRKDPVEKFVALHASEHPQAQFLWAIHRDLFHYCAVHLAAIANNARDLDLAIRWGFGWNQGPFETWQIAGWKQVTQWIKEDIASGKSMSKTPLPAWVEDIETSERRAVHTAQGSYAPATRSMQSRSALPVYKRQLFPDRLAGEEVVYGETIFETDAVRMWHTGDEIAIVSFSKCTRSISTCSTDYNKRSKKPSIAGALLVIWQTEPLFAGANLQKLPKNQKRRAALRFRSIHEESQKIGTVDPAPSRAQPGSGRCFDGR